jgi:chaperonin GroES
MKLKPIDKKIIIEPAAREVMTKGGIILPDIANQRAPTSGMVMSMAESSSLKKDVKVGDRVLFNKFAGIEITFPRKSIEERDLRYLIMPEADILAVLIKK